MVAFLVWILLTLIGEKKGADAFNKEEKKD